MWRQDMSVPRRFAETVEWLSDQKLLIRRKLGLSELLLIPSACAVHETMVKMLRHEPMFLVKEPH
jgi:hypothetical protein